MPFASEKAIDKAKAAMEERFEAVGEWDPVSGGQLNAPSGG
jgi:hypothetical protein